MKNSITERIFDIVDSNNLNNNKLAIKLGITRQSINDWRIGKSEPSPKIILKFLFHFPEVDANWLIRGTKQNTTTQTVTENKNRTQQVHGNSNNVVNESSGSYSTAAQKEIEYLKQIINSKDEQITLLNKLIDK